MKRTLIFCYFVFIATVLVPCVPADNPDPDTPLWLVTLGIFAFTLVAASVLLYGLSYRPKAFVWVWKIVPFVLIAYLAASWYLEFILYPKPDDSLLQTVFATASGLLLLSPAFWLTFKFGYAHLVWSDKPNLKLSLKYIAIIVLVTVLCIAIHFAPDPEQGINVTVDYVAEYNKITKPADYDPNQNAAPYYQKAFETLVDIPDDIQAIRKTWPGDMNNTELSSVKNWLDSNEESIPHLKAAAQKPYYWVEHKIEDNHLIAIAMPEIRKLRTAVYLFSLKARLLASQSQIGPALQDVIDMYKMGAHLKGPKTLVEQLTGIAIRSLAAHDAFQILDKTHPPPRLLQNFQNQLTMLSVKHTHTMDFTFEKLMVYDNIQRMFTDDGKGGGHVYGTRDSKNKDYLESLWGAEISGDQKEEFKKLERHQTTELVDKLYDAFSQAATKTPWQLHQEGLDLEKVAAEMTKDNPFVNMLVPNAGRTIQISFYRKAHVDALIATIVILRYKADKSQLPDSLEQLISSGYLKELPMDPYSDGSMVYKRVADNFTLYSLGADFDDDGGTPSEWGEGEEGGD